MAKLFLWLICTGLVATAGYFGSKVPFSEQWPLFEALRTTASIIFAVVGAWFAIIYPERLKLSFRGGKPSVESGSDSGIHHLFTPIVHSTCILSIVLVIGVAAPILKRVEFLAEYTEICRGLSFGILTALTLWQLLTVLYSLIAPDMLKTQADHEDRQQKVVENYTGGARQVARKKDDA